MAQTRNATPNKGREWELMVLGVMLAVFVGMVTVGYMAFRSVPQPVVAQAAPVATNTPATLVSSPEPTPESPRDVDDEPAVPSGVKGAWEMWDQERAAKKEMGYALTDERLHPDFTTQELAWLIWYERQGWDFTVWVPKGTMVVNTGYRNGSYYVTQPYALREGRWGLYRLNGEVAVFESCGNAGRVVRFGPYEEPTCPKPRRPRRPDKPDRPDIPKPLRNDNPDGSLTPHHPNNDTYNYPGDPGRTPGIVTPDELEEIAKDQESQTPGNRDSTPHGTDSGSGENPTNSETTNPDGSTEEAEQGTVVEDDPPTNEVIEGSIDPDAVE